MGPRSVWRAALANLCCGEPGEATSEAINASHKLLAATFVYGSSHAFDQIIYTGAQSSSASARQRKSLLRAHHGALAGKAAPNAVPGSSCYITSKAAE